MKRTTVLLLSILLSLFTEFALGQTLDYVHEKFEFVSEILGEKRKGQIFLPDKFSGSLPVLYVLDGEWNHQLASGVAGHFIRWGRIPNMAIVSLNNTNRTRDLTPTEDEIRYPGSGSAEAFLAFFEKEFIPYIESKYKLSDQRILFGHSFGGLFALYTLKENANLFNGYIAVSPSLWWKDDYMYEIDFLDELNNKPFVYTTAGTNDRSNNEALKTYNDLIKESGKKERLEYYSEIHENEDHFTNVSISLHEGLKMLFPVEKFRDEFLSAWEKGGKEQVERTLEKNKQRYGFRFRIPEEAIRTYAYRLHSNDDKTQEAIDLLSWLGSVYDENYQVFYFLGAIAKEDGRKEMAKINFKKALELGGMPSRMEIVIKRNLKEVAEN